MNSKEKTRKNNGITLIALVITIIVMLILVAVTISMAVNGGLFNFAGKASKDTQNAIDKEQSISDGIIKIGDKYYTIGEYVEQVTQNNNSRIRLSYTITPSEDKKTAVITVNARMLGGYIEGYKEYGEWAAKKLEGKTDEEIKQIFLNGENYWATAAGLQEFENIEAIVAYFSEINGVVYSDLNDMITDKGFNNLSELAIDQRAVYPEQYEYWDDYYIWAISQLRGKTDAEIEQVFLDGINYNNAQPFNNLDEFVNTLKQVQDSPFIECNNIYDVVDVIGAPSLTALAIEAGYVYPEKYESIEEKKKDRIINITDPSGKKWNNVNTVEYTVSLLKDDSYTFIAVNETETESNSITVYTEGYLPIYKEAEFDGEYLAENATYTSGNYTAVIPAGFKIIPGINNTTTIADGLVIQDKEGNEFVWIPVTYTKESTLDEDGYDTGFKKAFYRGGWTSNEATVGKRRKLVNSDITEPYANGYTGEDIDYNKMLNSVYHNGGFYIGRYEAGIKTTGSARTGSTGGTITDWVVQRNCYPYNYVGWGPSMTSYTGDIAIGIINRGSGALKLCKNFYTEKDKVGVTSTLCYGIMWDAMLDFIKDSSHDVTNSTTWGNYKNNAWTITNENAWYSEDDGETWAKVSSSGKTKDSSTRILLTTGASDSFAAKNIYDVAGNVSEWTNEAYTTLFRVTRGSHYYTDGGSDPASQRGGATPKDAGSPCYGFRPVLYIK